MLLSKVKVRSAYECYFVWNESEQVSGKDRRWIKCASSGMVGQKNRTDLCVHRVCITKYLQYSG